VNEVLKHGDANAMYIHDMYGVRVIENAPNKPDTQLVTPTTRVNTQFTVVDKALQEQLKADIDGVDSYLKNDPEARKFDVKSFEEYATNTTTNPYTKTTTVIKTDATPEQSSDRPHINQAELVKYIYNASSVSADTRKQMTFSNMTKLPTLDEMKKWGMVDEYGMPRADRYSNPTAASIMTEIEYMVDKLWVFPNAQDKQDSQEDFTFAGNNIISLPRITRRKVINLLKAIVDQASAFHQFFETTTNKIDGVTYSQPLPLVPVDSYGNLVYDGDKYPDIGLTQINCYSEGGARNLEEFRRVAWDWRYNLHCGIARFASCYDTNYNSANADQKTMPLDYAMTLYKGTGTQLTDSSVQNLIGIFFNRYAKAGLEYATPETPRDETAAQAENAKLTIQYKLSKDGINDPLGVKETSLTADEKSKGIRLLIWGNPPNSRCPDFYKWYQGIDDHVYLNLGISAITIADITPYCSGTQIGDGRVAGYADILDNCDLGDAVFIAIDDYLKRNSSFDPSTSVIGVTEPNPPPKPTSMDDPRYPRGFDAEVLTGSTLSEAVNTYAVSATFLPDKSTAAADAMYGSFRDSIEYDMRGRLVRAYPSFQMFIIDEGRWTFWYKLWDNLYGYNAIQSIDLIRNREIVADTLVMQMTNVYNNLSTKSSIYDDIDDSFTILNLFSGSSKDRTDAWQTIWGIANDDIIQAMIELT
jgi:hypothetical protein